MKTRTLLFSCLAIVLAGCKPAANAPAEKAAESAPAPPAAKSNKPQVLVANYPLQYFAQRLAGDSVEVRQQAMQTGHANVGEAVGLEAVGVQGDHAFVAV